MKIIHTSDWHLGARFYEEDREKEHAEFLAWLLDRIDEETPDALLVAGDVFDVKAPSPSAQEMYYRFLAEVARRNNCGKVIVTAGNHDNARLLAAPAEVLHGIGVSVVAFAEAGEEAAKEVVVVEDAAGKPGLVVGAVPFMYAAELSNFGADKEDPDAERGKKIVRGWERHYAEVMEKAERAAPGAPVVLMGHCMLSSASVSDDESERCRTVGGLDAYDPAPLSGADYVALGHLHRPQEVKGFEKNMFYSGSPLSMSFDEAKESKYVNVVAFGEKGAEPEVRKLEVPRTVPIITVQGKPEDVKVELAKMVAEAADRRRFVRVRLEAFEGSATQHWSDIREIVKPSATLVLDEEDVRPIAGAVAGLAVFGGKTITQITPREMAGQKLKTSNAHYSEEQLGTFMKMFDEVAGGVR